MKQARKNHATCCMDQNLFVFCGCSQNYTFIDSVEVLDLTMMGEWNVLYFAELTARMSPAVCPMGHGEVLVMGGIYQGKYHSDAIMLDFEKRIAQRVAESDVGIGFHCLSSSVLINKNPQVVLSLVQS